MSFDGIAAKCIVEELSDKLTGGRIEKVFQPEADELALNIRSLNSNYRLVLSASANYPRIHLTSASKENPMAPPMFCMLLRKHLSGGKILGFEFHDYERIIGIRIESVNELGDISEKKLIIEIMGRYSNIIFVNSEDKIIDAIKHIDSDVSSVREVMPARPYVLPPQQDKKSLEFLDYNAFILSFADENAVVEKHLLNSVKGFSPLLCREVCHRADVDGKKRAAALTAAEIEAIVSILKEFALRIADRNFAPVIAYEDKNFYHPLDFHCLGLTQYQYKQEYASMSQVLDIFYSAKDLDERLKQKKADLFKVLGNNIERCSRKLALQQEKLREVADRDNLRLYGELITANIYCIPANTPVVSLMNYYSEAGEHIDVPLDTNLTPQENAQRYFRKYSKAKSAYTNTSKQVEESQKELDYLESVLQLLENCNLSNEIEEVRQELASQGYMTLKRKPGSKKVEKQSEPLRFVSSDGFDILVGKNNKQNDQLTLKIASSNDIWLHTKNIPGSHVIIKKQKDEIPDRTLFEAAMLAAFHSKARQSSGVPVDFTAVKNVKKPSGAKPGMVIYENYRTITVTPEEKLVKELSK